VSIVNDIQPNGSTNLSGGLIKGAEVLKEIDCEHFIKRIFLFSDSIANIGVTSHEGIFSIVDRIVTEDINVSSFGLGIDYDEVIMRNIGEKGLGYYFYIEKSEDITRIISHSIHGLIDLIGTNCIVRFNPIQGSIVKIYDIDDFSAGYVVGDLNANGTANVVMKYQVNPGELDQELNLFSYTVRYLSNEEVRNEKEIVGNFVMPCSNRYDDLKTNQEVVVSVKVKEFRDKEKQVKELILNNNIQEAIHKKEEIISELQEFQDIDTSGRIKTLIDLCQKGLEEMQSTLTNNISISVSSNRKTGKAKMSTAKKYFDSADYLCKNDSKFTWGYDDAEDSSSDES